MTVSKGSTTIAVDEGTVAQLEAKYGREPLTRILREFDIAGSLEALTESEARYILRAAKDADAL